MFCKVIVFNGKLPDFAFGFNHGLKTCLGLSENKETTSDCSERSRVPFLLDCKKSILEESVLKNLRLNTEIIMVNPLNS